MGQLFTIDWVVEDGPAVLVACASSNVPELDKESLL